MDFDLFESDVEDDLLSAVNIEQTQMPSEVTLDEIMPELNCLGEDSLKSQLSADSFVKSGFINAGLNGKSLQELTFTNYDFKWESLNSGGVCSFVFGEACINIQYLMASLKGPLSSFEAEEQSVYQRRHKVTLLMHGILQNTSPEQWPFMAAHLQRLRMLLSVITNMDTWKLIYFANSSKGNSCNISAYHLLHGILEWKLLDLCILHKFTLAEVESEQTACTMKPKTNSVLFLHLEKLFDDLVLCSLFLFAKKHSAELLYSSPFPCTCIKEVWLMLQLLLQKWSLTALPLEDVVQFRFWQLFNKSMEKIKCKIDDYSLTALSYCEFANWLHQGLVRLHGYRSNGIYEGPSYTRRVGGEENENLKFLEAITQQFLQAQPNEQQMRIFISLLSPTLLEWWQPNVNVPMLLWEYFHGKLNSSFFVAGSAPSNMAVTCASGKSYLEKYRLLLSKPADANLSSYTLFVLLMGKCLENLIRTNNQRQAAKLLGRIYTKFSAQKFLALSEMGIHHLIELFLILALCGDFDDLSGKLKEKLLSISLEKITPAKQIAVIKGHMALWILYAERLCDLSDYIGKLLKQLLAIRNDLAVSKIMADTLLDVFEYSDTFQRGEHLLIGSWIPEFLNNCTPAEQERTLQALHMIFVKVQNSDFFWDSGSELLKGLNATILPFIKQQYMKNYSQWLPILAADFCIYSILPADQQGFQKLFSYFIDVQTINKQAGPKFLLQILSTERRNSVDSAMIMQTWLKSLVMLTASNEEVTKLSKIISQLPDFMFMTDLQPEELLQAKEPLCVFVASVGKKYDSTFSSADRSKMALNLNMYLQNFEKWLQSDLRQEKTELIFRFYSFLAIVIYNCPEIAYSQPKITCFFHVAITRYILTTSIQMGKPPEGKLAQLVHKIWPVLVQGIGKLHFKMDTYLNKTLTDLIQKWTPNFKISQNAKQVAKPFITCLQGDNHELTLFIFEKLTSLFLSTQRRQAADPNACLVITIYQEIVDHLSGQYCATSNDDDASNQLAAKRLETFMKGCSLATLEHIMMVDELVPSRQLLLELFKRILHSPIYLSSVHLKDLLREHLRILTKKHLAYYTFFYFELLMKLCTLSHELLQDILPFLLEEIRIVEQKRGAGEDNRIRGCLSKLNQAIQMARQKKCM